MLWLMQHQGSIIYDNKQTEKMKNKLIFIEKYFHIFLLTQKEQLTINFFA